MFRYVLTGGHGVGKTALLLYLQLQGEYVIRESASDYKYVQMAMGEPFPLDNPNAENNIFKIQVDRELKIDTSKKRVFFDRSIVDHFAYSKIMNQSLKYSFNMSIMNYDIVFLLSPGVEWGISLCTKREQAYSNKIAAMIETEYRLRGFRIVRVPPLSLEQRMTFIKEEIDRYES